MHPSRRAPMGIRSSAMGIRSSASSAAAADTAAAASGSATILSQSASPSPASRRVHRALVKIRWYMVWNSRGHGVEDLIGIHEGDIGAWWEIDRRLAGCTHLPGQHFRRVGFLAAAVNGFYSEAVRHGFALPAKFSRWPLAAIFAAATSSTHGSTLVAPTDGPVEQ